MFLRELSPIDKIQLNLLSAHGCGMTAKTASTILGFAAQRLTIFNSTAGHVAIGICK
jgi:hypothetical protein